MNNKKSINKKIYPKVLLFSGLFVVLVVLVCLFVKYTMPEGGILNGVSQGETADSDAQTSDVANDIMDSSTYKGQVYNLYRAYETGIAEYQMATLAPPYKEYVMENFNYADETSMLSGLQSMLDQTVANYISSFGEGYSLFENITNEVTLDKAALDALNEEMKQGYERDFFITEAKELTVEITFAKGGEDTNSEISSINSAAVGKIKTIMTVGKLKDDGWYILKERGADDEQA